MKRCLIVAAVAAGMTISSAAFAGNHYQLAAHVGLPADEVSLDQLAAAKFSGEAHDNVQAFVDRTALPPAGAVRSSRTADLSLDEYGRTLINAGVSGDERQRRVSREGVSSNPASRARLAAAVGASDAGAMSLQEVAALKFAADPDRD